MPELPEVEAARRGLDDQYVGHAVSDFELMLPRFVVAPDGLTLEALRGRRLARVERHGKYLTLRFDDNLAAVLHLKLSGQLAGRGPGLAGFTAGHPVPAYGAPLPHKSTHLTLLFDHGATLYFTDMRHWARLRLLNVSALTGFRAGLQARPRRHRAGLQRRVAAGRVDAASVGASQAAAAGPVVPGGARQHLR